MLCKDCKDLVCSECGCCGCETKEYMELLIEIKRLCEGRCYEDGDTMVDAALDLIDDYVTQRKQ